MHGCSLLRLLWPAMMVNDFHNFSMCQSTASSMIYLEQLPPSLLNRTTFREPSISILPIIDSFFREVEPSNKKSHKPFDTSLWVDRYRPQRFTDLLGDDRVHREVMTWVKEWEWCVFGKSKATGRGIKRPRSEEGENQDEWRRPQEKVSSRETRPLGSFSNRRG